MLRLFTIGITLFIISCTSGLDYIANGEDSTLSVKIGSLPDEGYLNKAWVFIEKNNYIHHYKEDFSIVGNTINIENTLNNYNLIIFIPSENWSYDEFDNLDGKGWYASRIGLNGKGKSYKVTDWAELDEYNFSNCGTIKEIDESFDNTNIDNAKLITGDSFISGDEINNDENLYYKLPIEDGYTYYLYLEDKSSNPNVFSAKVRGVLTNYFENQVIDEYVTSNPQTGIVSIDNYSEPYLYLRVETIANTNGEFRLRVERKLDTGGNLSPHINFMYPKNGTTYTIGESVNIAVNCWDYDGDVSCVKYYINDLFVESSTYPFTFTWDSSDQEEGVYTIRAIAEDNFSGISDPVEISIAIGQQIFFSDGFELGLSNNWILNDHDGDGENWEIFSNVTGYNSSSAVTSHSYINEDKGALNPDNYLISKKITILPNSTLEYYVCVQDKNFGGEHYSVLISTTDTNVESFTTIYEESLGSGKEQGKWFKRTINIDVGGDIHIAFRHHDSTDLFAITLDDVKIFKN